MSLALAAPPPRFMLPPELLATSPPEARGLSRDGVRLMGVLPDAIEHTRFADLPALLRAGDLLVVNTSRTIAAAVDAARAGGRPVTVHFALPLDAWSWVVELRRLDGSGPELDIVAGERIELGHGAALTVVGRYTNAGPPRLWRTELTMSQPVLRWLSRHGRPITYGQASQRWPLSMYQTVFAKVAGSVEMPSAARPFTDSLVGELRSRGVQLAGLLLHASVSSPEASEGPLPERFAVPRSTAAAVNRTRRTGGRVIAVGTTVVRALESAAECDGRVSVQRGWTTLTLSAERPARAVDALITGWHEPESSHLRLLESVAGDAQVRRAYGAALSHGYLWHEFGDSCLLFREGSPN